MINRLLAVDEILTRRLRVAEQPGAARSLAILFAHSGDSWFWLAGLALLGWLGGAEWRARCLWLIGAIFAAALIVFAIKFTVRRRRPEASGAGYTGSPTRIPSLPDTPRGR